jgi:predicted RNase H-like HicB family nuclease
MRGVFNIVVFHEAPWYVAKCVENDVASQGATVDEALANVREALELFYEGEPDLPVNPPAIFTTVEIAP